MVFQHRLVAAGSQGITALTVQGGVAILRSGSFLLLTKNEVTQDAPLSIESTEVRLLAPKGFSFAYLPYKQEFTSKFASPEI